MSSDQNNRQALAGLLTHIREEVARECAEIENRTEAQIRDILRDARRQARQRVVRALAAQRAELDSRCASERAAVETRLRRRHQQLSRQALDQGWGLLHAELIRRWQSAPERQEWAQAALRSAQSRLVARCWRVHCPPDWPIAQRQAASAAIGTEAVKLQWQDDPAMACGLRIAADGACVDATPAGLLAQRDRIEGRLLAAIEAAAQAPSAGQ
ncbi:MAG: hypothetical protein KGJ55_01245 [Gammaproteobacteria bacterium]|nr:hypothetical protein [Gammaproteobacteria bacterium]